MDVRQSLLTLWRQAARDAVPLPPEVEIAAALGVSRPTVREELIRMESAGLLRRHPRQGTFPNPAAVDAGVRIDAALEYSQALRDAGLTARVEVVDAGWTVLDERAADDLGAEPGSSAWATTKRWLADDVPVMVARDVVPARRRPYAPADPDASVYGIVGELRGTPIEWERVQLTAAIAEGAAAELLDTVAGAAVLSLCVVGVSRHGERLFRAEEHHRGGLVPYTMLRNAQH
ncbi:GntR family transcriptional regulator [Streptomyces sp. NPDC047000]|uniref:GntR family transcriptional regulator n=1 Tax=Streptomyces sp. NPDC047000 TaxID=3155474 RepID=UPI0034068B9C